MSIKKLSKSPLQNVQLRVGFPFDLKIAETRSKFADLIQSTYPVILIPEIKTLTFDLSDIIFRNKENTTQLRVSINSFVYETANYGTFQDFWDDFKACFSKFSTLYGISQASNFNLAYLNNIKIDTTKPNSFTDYFSLDVNFRKSLPGSFLAAEGGFVYKIEDGTLQIELRPQLNKATNAFDSMNLRIECDINKNILLSDSLAQLSTTYLRAHDLIESSFCSALTDKYIESIK